MHRNTYLLLIFLAVAAAVVAGVNLTREKGQETGNNKQEANTPPSSEPTPAVYTLAGCGIAFPKPDGYESLEGLGNSVVFTSTSGGDAIIITCQKDIPRPALPADKIEKLAFTFPEKPGATFSATLYHDTSDKLIFKHPTNKLDIFISGTGDSFQALIRNLSILQ